MSEMTPMMQQYMKTKEEYPDCILFYRLGDFYEMFFEDAKKVSKELELTLTGKSCGLPERAFPTMRLTGISTVSWRRGTKSPSASRWKTRHRPKGL